MLKVQIDIVGEKPLIMHSDRVVDPFDKLALEFKGLTQARGKDEAAMRVIAQMEWQLGLYIDKEVGPYIPSKNLKACLRGGGGKIKPLVSKDKSKVAIFMQDPDGMIPLIYDGPRDLKGLWEVEIGEDKSKEFVFGCSANNSGSSKGGKVWRTRPIFRQWKLRSTILLDETIIDFPIFEKALNAAGQFCGLGDDRPEFGLFTGTAKVLR